MAFKLVISDPKTRKSYQKEVSGEGILGKKIGDKFSGSVAGLEGYELQVTGGSDKDGFPMRRDVEGPGRKRVLLSGPPGFHPAMGGQRKRKSVRGGTVSDDLGQVNAKVVKEGKQPLDKVFVAAKKEEKPAEGEAKEGKAEEKPKEEKEAEPAKEGKPSDESKEEKKEEEPQESEGSEKPAEEKE
jgi:small subunit ribosomal protein S6e